MKHTQSHEIVSVMPRTLRVPKGSRWIYQEFNALPAPLHLGCCSESHFQQESLRDEVLSPFGQKADLTSTYYKNGSLQAQCSLLIMRHYVSRQLWSMLSYHTQETWGHRELLQTNGNLWLLLFLWMKSFVSDPGVLCLLSAPVK